jgi:limonene 1,2-monooxygenase
MAGSQGHDPCGPRDGLRFGGFCAPYHTLEGDANLQLRRDIDLAEMLDHLGYDEIWFGEHHSAGFETSAAPEIMIAAASQRTKRIRLGAGVFSAPFHHPLILADRINLLDHITMGRMIAGFGPGQLPSDNHQLGVHPSLMRDRLGEALAAIVPLLRGERVSVSSDWFDMKDGYLQIGPYTRGGIDMAVASVFSPAGATIAGRHGLGLLSVAAADGAARDKLVGNWEAHVRAAELAGHTASRAQWRVLGILHLADTRDRARRDVMLNIMKYRRMFEDLAGIELDWRSADDAIDQWSGPGIGGAWGTGIIGTPEDAIKAIESLLELTGGFGTYLLNSHGAAAWPATRHSWELFAEYVIPHFRSYNASRRHSADWVRANNHTLIPDRMKSIAEANAKYGAPNTAVNV